MPRKKKSPDAHIEDDYVAGDDAANLEGNDSDFGDTEAHVTAEPIETVPPAASEETVKVLLLGDHVFLPQDPTAPDWASCQTTTRVAGKENGRRVRIDVHPTLAAFLQERGQAEILD